MDLYRKLELSGPNQILLLPVAAFFVLCILAGLEVVPEVRDVIIQLIVLYWGLVVLRHLALLYYALRESAPKALQPSAELPLVSVIIPAYNEEKVIEDAVDSMLKLDYPNYEIIVIDDGSTDKTGELVKRIAYWKTKAPVRYIWQKNRGKAAALNNGIKNALGDFFLCVDADSRLNASAVLKGLRHFHDPRVGAVGGIVQAANEKSILAKFQQLEYMISQNFLRQALSFFGAVLIVPGPVGLFRRRAVLAVGGYREDVHTFSEDADLTVRLLAAGWRVKAEEGMIAYTEVPERVFDLMRQRYRWKRGVYQAFRENLISLLTAGGLRELLIGLFLASEAFLLDVANFGITLFFLTQFLSSGSIDPILALYLVIIALDVVTVAFACRQAKHRLKWIMMAFPQKFSYSYVLHAWNVLSLMDEWRATGMTWDKLGRIGTINGSVRT